MTWACERWRNAVQSGATLGRFFAEAQPDLCPDGRAVHLAGAFEADLQPVVLGPGVAEELAAGDHVEVAVVVEIGPGGLVGLRQGQAGAVLDLLELPRAPVAVEDALVAGVDGGEVEIEPAVVVIVAQGRRGVRLLPA